MLRGQFTGPAFHTRAMDNARRNGATTNRAPDGVPPHVIESLRSEGEFDQYERAIHEDLRRARTRVRRQVQRNSTPAMGAQAINPELPSDNLSEEYWEGRTYVNNLHGDIPDIDLSLRQPEVPAQNAGTRLRDCNPLNHNSPPIL